MLFLLPVFTEAKSVKLVAVSLAAAIVEGEALVLLLVVPELIHITIAWSNHLNSSFRHLQSQQTFGNSQMSWTSKQEDSQVWRVRNLFLFPLSPL